MPFRHPEALVEHFEKHKHEFTEITIDEYGRMADIFMLDPLPLDVKECRRKNGDRVRFDPKTEEFGVLSSDGFVRTYLVVRPLQSMRMTAIEYFERQCKK